MLECSYCQGCVILNLSMEVEGETGNKRKEKFRSCRRKKRKGFHGKKAREVRREAEEND